MQKVSHFRSLFVKAVRACSPSHVSSVFPCSQSLDDANSGFGPARIAGAAFIDSLEVNGILSMQGFVGLERDRTHMLDVLTGAFGLPSSSIPALTLHSRVFHVWEVINKRVAERLLVASQYTAYGETLVVRQRDFLIYVEALSSAKGLVIVVERVPGQDAP